MSIVTTQADIDAAAALDEPRYYTVQVASGHEGCAHCSAGRYWTICWIEDGEPIEIGQSFGDEELVTDICELMNMAYDAGTEQPNNEHALWEKVTQLERAANEVLRVYMPQFNDSRAVDDCLVGLAAAVAGAKP
jgi:hypothetical protein